MCDTLFTGLRLAGSERHADSSGDAYLLIRGRAPAAAGAHRSAPSDACSPHGGREGEAGERSDSCAGHLFTTAAGRGGQPVGIRGPTQARGTLVPSREQSAGKERGPAKSHLIWMTGYSVGHGGDR